MIGIAMVERATVELPITRSLFHLEAMDSLLNVSIGARHHTQVDLGSYTHKPD